MLCEICQLEQAFEKHHIHSKCYGGSNKKTNIANLCPNCHNKVHRGHIILEGKFMTTEGRKLIYHFQGEPSVTGNEPRVYLK